jgi:hypothetical protein
VPLTLEEKQNYYELFKTNFLEAAAKNDFELKYEIDDLPNGFP